MYFLSDYGENLFDIAERKFLHGYETPTKHELETPLFTWSSDNFKQSYSDVIYNLLHHLDKKIMATNTFHTILEMANIHLPYFNYKENFAHKKMDTLHKEVFIPLIKQL